MSLARPATDRSQPPPPAALRPFDFPPFHHQRLANGLRVLAMSMPRVPLVDLQILVPAGGQFDAPELPGLANLHGGLLDEGTARRSSLELAGLVEGLGGSLGSGAGWNMAYIEAGLLSDHLDRGLELLAEVVRSPGFAPSELDRTRQRIQAEILRRKGLPASLAERFFAAAVYGDTVYGRPLIGTAESLDQIDRDHLKGFYDRHVVPDGSTLIAVGDLDVDQLMARVEHHLGDWHAAPRPSEPVIEPAKLARTEVHIVDRPGSAQTQLLLGHLGVPRSHPDYPQTTLLNAIFGGKFTSRINLNLREEHGFTYGAQSSFARRRGPGPFSVRAAVATEVTGAATEQLLLEMRRIQQEPVSVEELRETQDYLVGVFPYTLQTISDIAKRLEAIAIFDLPSDYYEHYPAVLGDISREEVLAAAQRHFDPDHLAIIAVGSAEDLRPQLESFGPVLVHQP
ncbi:MAG: pitrilysin family protein [Acidobacteriota bacterium]